MDADGEKVRHPTRLLLQRLPVDAKVWRCQLAASDSLSEGNVIFRPQPSQARTLTAASLWSESAQGQDSPWSSG